MCLGIGWIINFFRILHHSNHKHYSKNSKAMWFNVFYKDLFTRNKNKTKNQKTLLWLLCEVTTKFEQIWQFTALSRVWLFSEINTKINQVISMQQFLTWIYWSMKSCKHYILLNSAPSSSTTEVMLVSSSHSTIWRIFSCFRICFSFSATPTCSTLDLLYIELFTSCPIKSWHL